MSVHRPARLGHPAFRFGVTTEREAFSHARAAARVLAGTAEAAGTMPVNLRPGEET